MSTVTVGQENSTPIDLYYEDHGSGTPVILIHGYPGNSGSWEKQTTALLAAGHRVITYDRRGFGKSSKPTSGFDFDTFAADLRALITKLALTDLAIIGFSMAAGEVARYMGKYGSAGIRKAGIISGVTPYLLKAPDNPDGVDLSVFEGIAAGASADRYAFFTEFLKNYYNLDVLLGKAISEQALRASWNAATALSATASVQCVHTWHTDFRQDLQRIDVPTLVMHGDEDRIVPIAISGARTAQMINGARYVAVKGGPHGMCWTHADQINAELLAFLK